MKFILSFAILTSVLSAETCYKLSIGNAALTPATLCNQQNVLSPTTPLKCELPTLKLPTMPTIKCNLPGVTNVDVSKCSPAPVECPKTPTPVIENSSNPGCGHTPDPRTPSTATPEPTSYALLGAGLVTAGIARFRKNKLTEIESK